MTAPPSAGCGEIEDEIVPPQSPLPNPARDDRQPLLGRFTPATPQYSIHIYYTYVEASSAILSDRLHIYVYTNSQALIPPPPIPKQVLTTIKEIHCQGLQAINGKTTHELCESEGGRRCQEKSFEIVVRYLTPCFLGQTTAYSIYKRCEKIPNHKDKVEPEIYMSTTMLEPIKYTKRTKIVFDLRF